ncbi:MAG: hypothetical protein AABX89_04985 [Candidatus Thermoplasmatota archaeon]
MRTFALLFVSLLALAGCATVETTPTGVLGAPDCPASPFDQPGLRILAPTDDPIDDEKGNATVFETTNLRTCSLPAIGHTNLTASGPAHKYIGEIDMRGDLNLGAVAVLGNGEAPGFYILDITERATPVVLSYTPQPGAYVTDIKFSDDGAVLYVASQQTPGPEFVDSLPTPVAFTGFTVYGLADPTAPTYLGTVVDLGFGCHMLDPVQVAVNQDAVMCVSQHLRSYLIQRDGPVILNFGFVDYIPTRDGVPAPVIPVVGDPTGLLPVAVAPHDMTAYHPSGSFGAGSALIVSHWTEGLKVLDISQAPLITEIGSWNGEGATHYNGNVHTAMVLETSAGRYLIASPEYTSDGTIPGFWVLDATDFGNLRLVAEWYHPGNHTSQGLYLTTHQWQVAPSGTDVAPEEVRLYFTYNHAGIWVLDFASILAGDNAGAILGYNLARTPIPEDHVPNAILSTWDVNVVDGHIYGSDRATGLWVFHYAGDTLGDERLTGFA